MTRFLCKGLAIIGVSARIGAAASMDRERLTRGPGPLWPVLLLLFTVFASGQNTEAEPADKWSDEEITGIFDGIDLTAALARLEAKKVSPYDFGFDLMREGHPAKAKDWYHAIGSKTRDLKYIYALAWVEWVTGNSVAALDDCKYILTRNPKPIIKARTYYLLGAVGVDDFDFEAARQNLQAGLEAYTALGKKGGQYLCTSMLAMNAVNEGKFDDVDPLLDKAEQLRESVKKVYSAGRYHEIRSMMRYEQSDFAGALIAGKESVAAYRESGEYHLADEVEAKVSFLLLLNGEPKVAKAIANRLWKDHHKKRSSGRLLAYNAITLMKLSLCSENWEDAESKEKSARDWAKAGPGGKSLLKLLEWAKDENKFPCPAEWR